MSYCVQCGQPLPAQAKFCGGCGGHQPQPPPPERLIFGQPPSSAMAPAPIGPPSVLASLRQHKEHTAATCLECGYQGHMGIVAKRVEGFWHAIDWLTGWFLILCGVPLIFLIPVGTIIG